MTTLLEELDRCAAVRNDRYSVQLATLTATFDEFREEFRDQSRTVVADIDALRKEILEIRGSVTSLKDEMKVVKDNAKKNYEETKKTIASLQVSITSSKAEINVLVRSDRQRGPILQSLSEKADALQTTMNAVQASLHSVEVLAARVRISIFIIILPLTFFDY